MKVQLKDIADITLGYPFRGRVPETDDKMIGIPVIQLKDCSLQFGINYTNCTLVELETNPESHYLQDQDILLAARSSQNYAVQFEQNSDQHSNFIASLNFFVIRITKSNILPSFITWQLNQAICQQYFERNSEGTAAKNIRRPIMEDLPIAIPDLATQQNIVKLAQAQNKERQLFSQLIQSNERIMTAIAQQINH